jgi:hypothetical protein
MRAAGRARRHRRWRTQRRMKRPDDTGWVICFVPNTCAMKLKLKRLISFPEDGANATRLAHADCYVDDLLCHNSRFRVAPRPRLVVSSRQSPGNYVRRSVETKSAALRACSYLTSDHCQIQPRLRVLSIDRHAFNLIFRSFGRERPVNINHWLTFSSLAQSSGARSA